MSDKTIDEIIREIDPSKEYSASAVVANGWTFWKMVLSFTTFLNTEEGRRLYKPIVFKQGAVMRYRVRGSEIISVLKLRKEGNLVIDYNG